MRWELRWKFQDVQVQAAVACLAMSILMIAIVAPARADCFAPRDLHDGLDVASPVVTGFSETALCGLLSEVHADNSNVHSVLVLRRGKLVAEAYNEGKDRSLFSLWSTHREFGPDDLHDLRSVSKGVTSLIYGVLLARGEVPGPETSVTSFYVDHPEFATPQKRPIRVRHLLTMTSGLEWDEPSPIHRAKRDDQSGLVWRHCLYCYVFKRDLTSIPGSVFLYSGGSTEILADMMIRATGKSLRTLAEENLFEPLGIEQWRWIGNLRGRPMAHAGLRLTPRGLSKIGVMMLANGRWKGRQIVPEDWLAEISEPRVAAGPEESFGYQWWINTVPWKGRNLKAIATIGNGGQTLFLVPELNLGVVTTAGNYGKLEGLQLVRSISEKIVAAVNE